MEKTNYMLFYKTKLNNMKKIYLEKSGYYQQSGILIIKNIMTEIKKYIKF